MAAPGHLSVSDDPACGAAPNQVRRTRTASCENTMGGAREPIHRVVGAIGYRLVEGRQPASEKAAVCRSFFGGGNWLP